MFLIVGLLVVIGSVLGGYVMHHGKIALLNQPNEFLIIGGAAIGSMLISTPLPVIMKMLKQTVGVLSPGIGRKDYADLLAMLYQLFRLAQQAGIMSLESHFENPKESAILSKYPKFLARHESLDFLSDSIKVIIVGGIAPHDLEALMDEDLHVHHDEARAPAAALTKVGDAMPGLGIVAAVLGIVITMGHRRPARRDRPPGRRGAGRHVPRHSAVLRLFVQPLATSLERGSTTTATTSSASRPGVLAIYKGLPPAIAIEFARRVLPHEVRPTFEETEKFCKAATASPRRRRRKP